MRRILCTTIFLAAFCSAPRAQWVQTSGPSNHTVLSLAARDSFLFAGTYSGAYFSTDNGDHWSATGSLPFPSGRVLSLAVMGSLVFAGTDGGVCRSSDNGTSWKAIDSGLPDRSLIHSLTVSGTKVYAGTHSHGVFLSVDSGATWTADSGLPATTSVYSLAVNGKLIFAGTWGAGVFRLSNDQTAWVAANSGLPANATVAYVLSLAATGAGVAAGIGSAIYTSADQGSHWTISATPLIGSPVNGLAATANDLFAATYSSGVFHSGNNGLSWASTSEGLPPTNSQGMCLAVNRPFLFLGTGNSGVWRRPLSEISAAVRNDVRAKAGAVEMEVGRNGILSYRLPRESEVSLKLFDLKGRLQWVAIDKRQPAGRYSLPITRESFPIGTYLLQCTLDGLALQRNLIICR
jgi:hypothetical protein